LSDPSGHNPIEACFVAGVAGLEAVGLCVAAAFAVVGLVLLVAAVEQQCRTVTEGRCTEEIGKGIKELVEMPFEELQKLLEDLSNNTPEPPKPVKDIVVTIIAVLGAVGAAIGEAFTSDSEPIIEDEPIAEPVDPPVRPTPPAPGTPTPCRIVQPYSAGNFRSNLACLTGGDLGPAYHAHHIFPQAREFATRWPPLLDIHDPHYGSWVDIATHNDIVHEGPGSGGAWNANWRDFFATHLNPSLADTYRCGKYLAHIFGLQTYWVMPPPWQC
jgi:hypothetical protein